MATYLPARVTNVRHWSHKLFSFTTTRGPALRFENGQVIMVALEVESRRLARAYSIASANHEDELEFYSIKAPNGARASLPIASPAVRAILALQWRAVAG